MRAVFEAVEPKLWLIRRRRWAEAAIALVIVACIAGLLASRIFGRTERQPDAQTRTSIDAGSAEHAQEGGGQPPDGEPRGNEAGANAGTGGPGMSGTRGKSGNYESPLAF